MHIFRKTLFLLSLFVAGFTSQAKAQISVMSFNIRLDASVDNENRWDNRKGEVAKMLTYYQPDLLGMQEVCPNQMADLKAALKADNIDDIKAKTDELQKAFYELSSKVYQAAGAAAGQDPNAAAGGFDGAADSGSSNDDNVVDADFTEA